MNLRTRFFLLVWPLTVAAMVLLALVFGRWGVTEINQVTVHSTVRTIDIPAQSQVDSVFSSTTAAALESPAARRRLLIRRILIALGVGSLLAAVATLLLSGPLVGRVSTLAAAVRDVRGGNLATRAYVHGSDELAELARAFNEMTQALSWSEGHRRQLLSDVSHELRSPLTNILGSLEAMEDGIVPFDRVQLARVHDEAMLLVRLVDDLRDVSLADAGALTLHPATVDAVALAVGAAAALPSGPDQAKIHLVLPPHPVALHADPGRVAQILRNLLDNARAHASPGSGITLELTADTRSVNFSVHNEGAVIPPEHLERIWERFYRVDRSRSRSTGGMGLGLAVVRRLVEAHNGTVAVQSDASTGTRFEVRMPVNG